MELKSREVVGNLTEMRVPAVVATSARRCLQAAKLLACGQGAAAFHVESILDDAELTASVNK